MKRQWIWLTTLMMGLCFFSFFAMAEEMEDIIGGFGETHELAISASSGAVCVCLPIH